MPHRGGTPENERMGEWLETLLNSSAPVGLASLVLSGVLRIVTHPRVFEQPTPLDTALELVESLRGSPNTVEVAPGPRHWQIFVDLCRATGARGDTGLDKCLALWI